MEKISMKFEIFVNNFLLSWIRRLSISFKINTWSVPENSFDEFLI